MSVLKYAIFERRYLIVLSLFILFFGGCHDVTYGTDKATGQQLLEDLANIVSLQPLSDNHAVDVDHVRPNLIMPSRRDVGYLPMPKKHGGRVKGVRQHRGSAPAQKGSLVNTATGPYLATGLDRGRERANRLPANRMIKQKTIGQPRRHYLSEPPMNYWQNSLDKSQSNEGSK